MDKGLFCLRFVEMRHYGISSIMKLAHLGISSLVTTILDQIGCQRREIIDTARVPVL